MLHALSSDLLGKHFRPTAFSSWPLLFSACDYSDPPLSARELAGKDGRCSKWNCIFSCLKTMKCLNATVIVLKLEVKLWFMPKMDVSLTVKVKDQNFDLKE